MAKITKKTKKADIKKIAHKTDWKFVITLLVLAIIGFGVFSIFRGLAAQNPEIFYGYPRGHHLNAETQAAKAAKERVENAGRAAADAITGTQEQKDIAYNLAAEAERNKNNNWRYYSDNGAYTGISGGRRTK